MNLEGIRGLEWGMQLSLLEKFSTKDLEKEKEFWVEIQKTRYDEKKKIDEKVQFISSQVHSLDWAIEKQENKRLQTVVPTDEHKKLLKNMEFEDFPDGGDYVCMGVEGKRPFGNSDVYGDIAEILGWEKPNDDLSDKQKQKAKQLMKELPYVLNSILQQLKQGD